MTSDRRNNTETNKTNSKSKFNNRNSKRAKKNDIDRKINSEVEVGHYNNALKSPRHKLAMTTRASNEQVGLK